MPKGRSGHATEVWRRGPGGFTFMEEFRDDDPTGESGLALIWWDKMKGFQSAWCTGTNPKGCTIFVNDPSASFKWDGNQQVIDNEFQRNGKTFRWHEVFSDITPTSFVQTADIGEKGGPLKRWLTIHGTRVVTNAGEPSQSSTSAAETRLVALANEWTEAINRKDRAKLDELMAPEYALYAWNGKLLGSRPLCLDNLFSHITIEKNTLTDISPRVYGGFAIVTSKADWIGVFNGQHFNKKCIVADTWRMLKGHWQVVSRISDCTDQ